MCCASVWIGQFQGFIQDTFDKLTIKHLRFVKYNNKSKLKLDPDYRQISNIRRTESQNLNVSRLVLHLFLLLTPGVKSRMSRHAMLQPHLSDQQVYCLLRCNLY